MDSNLHFLMVVLVATLRFILVVCHHRRVQHQLLSSVSKLTLPSIIATASFLPIFTKLSLKLTLVSLHCLTSLFGLCVHVLGVLW